MNQITEDTISIQDVLFEDESVLWEGTPDKIAYVSHIAKGQIFGALAFLLFDSFFIFMVSRFAEEIPKEMIIFMVGFFAIHLFPVWAFIASIIKAFVAHKNISYAITDRRIITRTGVVGLDFENINYTDITNIDVNVTIIEKIRKVGTVCINTSSGKSVKLISIKNPYQTSKMLNKTYIDINSDIHYPNALRPENNPGYNTKYTGQ